MIMITLSTLRSYKEDKFWLNFEWHDMYFHMKLGGDISMAVVDWSCFDLDLLFQWLILFKVALIGDVFKRLFTFSGHYDFFPLLHLIDYTFMTHLLVWWMLIVQRTLYGLELWRYVQTFHDIFWRSA